MVKNIMLVGVGGQGSLLASRVLGAVALSNGFDVKVSEVHGMSQRGGSVVTYVRYGDKVYSPIVPEGKADIILAFEQLEAYRYLPSLKKDGQFIVNTQRIDPMPVIIGAAKYPEAITAKLEAGGVNVKAIDALATAVKCGSVKAVNIVMIGVLARFSEIAKEKWIEAIKDCVPQRFLDINLNAFEVGYTL